MGGWMDDGEASFLRKTLHNTCHFNLTVHFQNWSLQLTLKITWSLAKIKVVCNTNTMPDLDISNFY